MKLALAQIAPKLSRDNLPIHQKIITQVKDCDLVIFPELSFNGYTLKDASRDFAYSYTEIEKIAQNSFEIDAIVGFVLEENGLIYNSSAYISSAKVEHIHKKIALPNYGMFEEARFFHKGKDVKPFVACDKQCITLICEDVWDSQEISFEHLDGIDIVFVVANSPARDFLDDGSLLIEKIWQEKLERLAQTLDSYVVFVNRVGFEDGMGFWGGSRVLYPDGTIVCKASLFEEEIIKYTIEEKK